MVFQTDEELLELFREVNYSYKNLADYLGISLVRVMNIIESRYLKDTFEEAKLERTDIAESALFTLVREGNYQAIKLFLELYSEKRDNNVLDAKIKESDEILTAIRDRHAKHTSTPNT